MEDLNELVVRCAMYREGELQTYYDFDIEGIERNLQWFEGAVDDETSDKVRIILYRDGRKVTSWNTPVDRDFKEFIENVIEELVDERFVWGVKQAND